MNRRLTYGPPLTARSNSHTFSMCLIQIEVIALYLAFSQSEEHPIRRLPAGTCKGMARHRWIVSVAL